jgi:pheromone shutdown protein TraB
MNITKLVFNNRDELLAALCEKQFGAVPVFEEDTRLKQQGAVAICKAGYVEGLENKLTKVREIVGKAKDHLAGNPTQNQQLIRGILYNIELALK